MVCAPPCMHLYTNAQVGYSPANPLYHLALRFGDCAKHLTEKQQLRSQIGGLSNYKIKILVFLIIAICDRSGRNQNTVRVQKVDTTVFKRYCIKSE